MYGLCTWRRLIFLLLVSIGSGVITLITMVSAAPSAATGIEKALGLPLG